MLQCWIASDHISIDKVLKQHFPVCDFISLLGDNILILKGSLCNQSFLRDMKKKLNKLAAAFRGLIEVLFIMIIVLN